jgi:hypothetical protein
VPQTPEKVAGQIAGQTAFDGSEVSNFLRKTGAPGAIPTRDLPLRRRTLYAAELREHWLLILNGKGRMVKRPHLDHLTAEIIDKGDPGEYAPAAISQTSHPNIPA